MTLKQDEDKNSKTNEFERYKIYIYHRDHFFYK